MIVAIATAVVLTCVVAALGLWRLVDDRRIRNVWRVLLRSAENAPAVFDASMVADLAEPARRFFLFTIAPGTRLRSVAELRMRGEIALGTKERPNFVPMRGSQILAPPHGFIWRVAAGRGPMRIAGSDGFHLGGSWSTFWLLGIIPIARAGGSADHARSAFGRVVAEAVFWAPAALLPQAGVRWEAVSADIARATVELGELVQSVDIKVADDGRPVEVQIRRWSNANPAKTFQRQPFGGYPSAFRELDGYRLPMRIEGGNFFGTANYFPFYKAIVEDVRLD